MPITVVFSRSRLFRSATMPAKSNVPAAFAVAWRKLPDRRTERAPFASILARLIERLRPLLRQPAPAATRRSCRWPGRRSGPSIRARAMSVRPSPSTATLVKAQEIAASADPPVDRIRLDRKSRLAKQADRSRHVKGRRHQQPALAVLRRDQRLGEFGILQRVARAPFHDQPRLWRCRGFRRSRRRNRLPWRRSKSDWRCRRRTRRARSDSDAPAPPPR